MTNFNAEEKSGRYYNRARYSYGTFAIAFSENNMEDPRLSTGTIIAIAVGISLFVVTTVVKRVAKTMERKTSQEFWHQLSFDTFCRKTHKIIAHFESIGNQHICSLPKSKPTTFRTV
jgi:hypothetical protein